MKNAMLQNVVLEHGSILEHPITLQYLPYIHKLQENHFIGTSDTSCSLAQPLAQPWETCLNCLYPRCLHGCCQALLSNGLGRGLQELEVLNEECRHLLLLYMFKCKKISSAHAIHNAVMDDDAFIAFLVNALQT